jgi:tripartite-type tricarboxylate transporter receptor subunit TctC
MSKTPSKEEKMKRRGFLRLALLPALATGMTFLWTGEVKTQSYPTRPITLVVPWNAGSATDLAPRVMVPKLSKRLGTPVNVVNKPGGAGTPGTLEVVKSREIQTRRIQHPC